MTTTLPDRLSTNPASPHYDQTVPFYIGRTLTLVAYVDEFETGQKAEPDGTPSRLHPPQFRLPSRV